MSKQTTIFGSSRQAAPVEAAPKQERPTWFHEQFWNALPPLERRIHCIAYKQLGSSYTVESTQQFIAWEKAGKPTSWSVHDMHH